MWNGVDLWPKDWEEDEHDFCVVEKADEHELQHDWKFPGVCESFVDPQADNKYDQCNDTRTRVSWWDSFDFSVLKGFLFFSDILSIAAAASPGILLDIKWQEDADEIENDVDVVGSKKEANDKGRYKYDPIELALRCNKCILTQNCNKTGPDTSENDEDKWRVVPLLVCVGFFQKKSDVSEQNCIGKGVEECHGKCVGNVGGDKIVGEDLLGGLVAGYHFKQLVNNFHECRVMRMHDISQVELETKQDQLEIISEVDASFVMVWHIAIKELHVDLVFRDREMRLVSWFCLFGNGDWLCFWHYLVLLIFLV